MFEEKKLNVWKLTKTLVTSENESISGRLIFGNISVVTGFNKKQWINNDFIKREDDINNQMVDSLHAQSLSQEG